MRLPARYDHVGSFLRPKYLLEAREQEGTRRHHRRATACRGGQGDHRDREVPGGQSASKSITDGEFRRTYFHIDFLKQLGGVKSDIPKIIIRSPTAPRNWRRP